jgi:hypothetical protein
MIKLAGIIGSKVLWRISNLNQFFKRGKAGELIKSRDDFIKDQLVNNEMRSILGTAVNKSLFNISKLTSDLIHSIENTRRKMQSAEIVDIISQFGIEDNISLNRLFKHITSNRDVIRPGALQDKIQNSASPEAKVSYAETLRVKMGIRLPYFPPELEYDWELAESVGAGLISES